MPKVIIIGATSGMGHAMAGQFSQKGFIVGLTGRRTALLQELKKTLPPPAYIQAMDVSKPELAVKQLQQLIRRMGGMDILILNAGVSFRNSSWEQDKITIATNVLGFTALARAGMEFFQKQRGGHLVGISSISGIRGRSSALVYSATKAFVSNLLQGWRQRIYHAGLAESVFITDIIPGYVDTPLIRGKSNHFWIAPVDMAARQIIAAILRRRHRAYITKRWQWIAWYLTLITDRIHQKQ